MIEAKELRIGDLVRTLDENCNLKTCKVVGIDGEACRNSKTRGFLIGAVKLRPFDLPDDEPSYSLWCEDIEPIPLTPEILEKNGWEWDGYDFVIGPLKVYPVSDYFVFDEFGTKLKCVHQLQHCLWVLGLDDEMKI